MNTAMKNIGKYIIGLGKWMIVSLLLGIVCGAVGTVFHHAVDFVTEIREANLWIMLLLPVGGLVICAMYSLFKKHGDMSTNRVIEAAKGREAVPFVMAPLIFIGTVITHLLGGSAGREGAALQLGGSFGYKVAEILKIKKDDIKYVVMAGMSGVFAALFGTPLTAAIFSMEVMVVGAMSYRGIVPCVLTACVGSVFASLFGCHGVHYDNVTVYGLNAESIISVVIVSLLCALTGILFCTAIHKAEHLSDKYIPNKYIRGAVGGVIIIILALIFRTTDYNGAGMGVIDKAISGQARYEAFLLKIIFTAITISAGFKGGEIVPTFFIGSTLGCSLGLIFGFDPSFCASLGFVALFCSVTNCPLASLILSVEVFGGGNIIFYAIACAISFCMSGKYSLYSKQEFSENKYI